MLLPENTFKRTLADRRTTHGLFLGLASSYCAEVVATAGFDWLLIDGEHGPNDVRSILGQLQAIASYPVHPVVRTADHSPALIKQLLDIGVQNLLIPMVETAVQAEALVRSVRYPPYGIRGVGTALSRAAHWNGINDYFNHADREICLIVQIESQAGLDNLDAIVAVDGIDGIFVGPSDLAASLGYLGQPGHPAVKVSVEKAIQTISAAGKAAGVFAIDPDFASACQTVGACFLAVGVDTLLLRNAAVTLAARFKIGTDAPHTTAAY